MNLMAANCPRCGRLYNRASGDVCGNCIREIEQQYEKCLHYLRENKGSNIYEVSDATEVPVRQISKFIREGRISIMDAPNMGYPCEVCGEIIQTGGMCDNCRNRLTRDVRKLTQAANPSSNGQKSSSHDHASYTIREKDDK
ncbi:flagellar protein [Marinicrinis sediminis]|uniref:Flagellar protein n=1 Tax=Marinicrinis sediminis TaxID=1652465 RepID=A0ABW5RAB2_9BACL